MSNGKHERKAKHEQKDTKGDVEGSWRDPNVRHRMNDAALRQGIAEPVFPAHNDERVNREPVVSAFDETDDES
jgi:hypothetical protein